MLPNERQEIKNLIDETIDENKTVGTLKQDVSILKQDVGTLKQDVSQIKSTLSSHGEELIRIGVLMEHTNSNVQHILEVLTPTIKKGELIDDHSNILEKHDSDILILQQVVKKHTTDKSLHRVK